jgi:hypothetical protein
MNRRQLVIGLALLGSAAWSAWVVSRDASDEVVQATTRASGGAHGTEAPRTAGVAPSLALSAPPSAAGAAALEFAARPVAPEHPRNLFGEYSYEPPKPKVAAPPPEPPQAPPLPMQYMGRLVVDGRTTYLLGDNRTSLRLALGEATGAYRLVDADDQNLWFLHGPTGQRVSVRIPPIKAQASHQP